MLPFELTQAIDELAFSISPGEIARAGEELSELYRSNQGPGKTPRLSEEHLLAYLVVRFPATFAACEAVFSELLAGTKSILDLGGGPGTAVWAARELFPTLEKATVYEQLHEFLKLGEKLASCIDDPLMNSVSWKRQDLSSVEEFPNHDLVVMSYSLGEIPSGHREAILRKAWDATGRVLVLIEPGTVPGYQIVMEARDQLLEWGGSVMAPCPHDKKCPMDGTESWCHFSQRLERSRRHRLAKGGTLGYEDEKYSYVVVTKEVLDRLPYQRVLSRPIISKAAIRLDLCTPKGERVEKIVPRREKASYKKAKHRSWGDVC